MKPDPCHFISINTTSKMSNKPAGGKYMIADTGCGCCSGGYHLTPKELKAFIDECIVYLQEMKNTVED